MAQARDFKWSISVYNKPQSRSIGIRFINERIIKNFKYKVI